MSLVREFVSPQINTGPVLDLLWIDSHMFSSSATAYGLPSGGIQVTPTLMAYGSDIDFPRMWIYARQSDSCCTCTNLYILLEMRISMPLESFLISLCLVSRGKWNYWYPGKFWMKCAPFIVSWNATMSCDLMIIWISLYPILSPRPLIFQDKILKLQLSSVIWWHFNTFREWVNSLTGTYSLSKWISLITALMLAT